MNSDLDEEHVLVQRLLDGDEAVFAALVDRFQPSMIRVALTFVREQAIAEEVAQDAWLAVLNGLSSFKGKSSLKSWIFAIVVNKAKTRGKREARTIPFSALVDQETSGNYSAVEPERFLGPDSPWPGHWMRPPESWGENPEALFLRKETFAVLARFMDTLPAAQRTVVAMRDIAGLDAEAICNELEISETNMRVLLHRGRSRLRGALERHFADENVTP